MKRSMLAILAVLASAAPAGAMSFLLEPEIGIKHFTGDAGDVARTGVSIGWTGGVRLTPKIVLVGSGNVAFHPTGRFFFTDTSATREIEGATSFAGAGGARIFPRAGKGRIQPYVGAQVGFAVLSWNYKFPQPGFFGLPGPTGDDLPSLILRGEVGLDYMVRKGFGFTAGGRVVRHAWSDQTGELVVARGFEGSELGLHAGVLLVFGE